MIRISKMADAFSVAGHEVEVLNASVFYKNPFNVVVRRSSFSALAGWVVSGKKGRMRDWIYAKLCESIVSERLKRERFDAVIAEGIIQGANVSGACSLAGVPLVTDVHGLASAEYSENKFHSVSEKRLRFLCEAEGLAARESAILLAVSKSMKDYFIGCGVPASRVVVAMNGADPSKNTARFAKPMRVIYAGIFAFWEDVDSFLDMARADLANEFFIAGRGPLKNHVEKRIINEKIRINYLGSLKRAQLLDSLVSMQVGLAPSVDALTRRVACPIKVFDYLAAGLPVVTPDFGDWAKIIRESEAGVVTSNSNAREFGEAISLLGDKSVWNKMSRNAIGVIRNEMNWSRVLQPVIEAVEGL